MTLDYSLSEILLRLGSGLVIGFIISLTGIGGGVLVLPALSILMRIEATMCVGTASFYALLTKMYAVLEHYRLRTIHFPVCLWFLAGAIPSDTLTAHLINVYRVRNAGDLAELAAFQRNLTILIVIVMFGAISLMVYQMTRGLKAEAEAREGQPPIVLTPRTRTLGVIFGALVGAIMGSTSISAVIIVPLLILFFGLTADRTAGSTIFIAVVLTLVTAAIYGKGGQVDYSTGIIMAIGSIGGVYAGSRMSVRTPDRLLKWIITALIAIAAVVMLLKTPTH